ncbi:MAG: hypothetical protein MUE70_00110 [Desulfobacterales bacterium]|jgi:hypothetical protein|nr:hypothetical protein [Desulfobacterales bacterium]
MICILNPELTTGYPEAQGLKQARDFGKAIARFSKVVADGDASYIVPERKV